MSKFFRSILLTAAATGAAALILRQIDLDAARVGQNDREPDFPGLDPDDMQEEDVAMLLNELASHL